MDHFQLTSPDFCEGGWIPVRNTSRGEDISFCLKLEGMILDAQSIAITLEDASHPLFPNYNHWIIWNIFVQDVIPEAIPYKVAKSSNN